MPQYAAAIRTLWCASQAVLGRCQPVLTYFELTCFKLILLCRRSSSEGNNSPVLMATCWSQARVHASARCALQDFQKDGGAGHRSPYLSQFRIEPYGSQCEAIALPFELHPH